MPVQQQTPAFNNLAKWRDGIAAVADIVSSTVRPPLRRKAGFNALQPGTAFVMTVVMIVFNAFMNFSVALPLIGRLGAHENV